jgi:pimeloyl-ACP methyl ester carboxylesterase
MLTAQINGLQIGYERAGAGPPLVLLHGILADSRIWRPQLAGLSDQFAVIAWDAPGAGQSSDPADSFGLADWADCLAGLLDALKVDRAHILGLSWGGVLAQEFYRRHPARVWSLILADTYAGWKGSLPEAVCRERLETCLREANLPPNEFVPNWLPSLLTAAAPPELAADVAAIMSDFHPVGYRLAALALADSDERDLLGQIRVPTLLVWGEGDLRSPLPVAEQFHAAIPGARLVTIPGAGHLSNREQPDRFNAAVRGFCQSVAGAD